MLTMPPKRADLPALLPNVRLTPGQHLHLHLLAERDGVTVSEAVRRMIERDVERMAEEDPTVRVTLSASSFTSDAPHE